MNREQKFVAATLLKLVVTCRTCGLEKAPKEMAVISRRMVECRSCREAPRACTKCDIVKPTTDFYTNGRKQNRGSHCKACEIARQAARKTETPAAQWMFDRVRHRAKAEGKPFTITVGDIFIPTHCPILGLPLAPVGAAQSLMSPSLDRLDATRGYVPGNVAVISRQANALKNNGTAEQHERIAAWMRAQGLK